MALTKKKADYYRAHEMVVLQDVEKAIKARAWTEVWKLFNEYGRYLERHEEAITVLA